jgi:hypothetical protein
MIFFFSKKCLSFVLIFEFSESTEKVAVYQLGNNIDYLYNRTKKSITTENISSIAHGVARTC